MILHYEFSVSGISDGKTVEVNSSNDALNTLRKLLDNGVEIYFASLQQPVGVSLYLLFDPLHWVDEVDFLSHRLTQLETQIRNEIAANPNAKTALAHISTSAGNLVNSLRNPDSHSLAIDIKLARLGLAKLTKDFADYRAIADNPPNPPTTPNSARLTK